MEGQPPAPRTRSMSLGRVLLKTALSPHTGYGQDGIYLTRALARLGFEVYLRPLNVSPPLPPDVAAHFTRAPEAPFDYLIHHTDPDQFGLTQQEIASSKVRICWTMWEFLGIGDMNTRDTLVERMGHYTHLFCYDDVSQKTLGEVAPDSLEISKLQGGYWSEDWLDEENVREWSGTFRYAMVGALNARKNPFAVVTAFKALKEEHGEEFDAELHLKTSVPTLPPQMQEWCPGLTIHSQMWPQEILKKFYGQVNLLVAPSWGEGKNLPALEAMTSGCPVAATDFGGHHEWLSSEWAYPLKYTLGEHVPGMQSARVDEEQLKSVMWDAYTNRHKAKAKGELAARTIPAMLDWMQVAERLRAKLLTL